MNSSLMQTQTKRSLQADFLSGCYRRDHPKGRLSATMTALRSIFVYKCATAYAFHCLSLYSFSIVGRLVRSRSPLPKFCVLVDSLTLYTIQTPTGTAPPVVRVRSQISPGAQCMRCVQQVLNSNLWMSAFAAWKTYPKHFVSLFLIVLVVLGRYLSSFFQVRREEVGGPDCGVGASVDPWATVRVALLSI